MVRAELKRLRGIEVVDLANFWPDEPDNFRVPIQAVIGPLGSKGEEAFEFIVCTAKWLENEVNRQGPFFTRAYLLVKSYNYDQIFDVIDQFCNTLSGDSWETIEYKLRLYGNWEYEDN